VLKGAFSEVSPARETTGFHRESGSRIREAHGEDAITYRGTFSYAVYATFIVLWLVLLAGVMLLEPSVVLAQEPGTQGTELMQGGSREIEVVDWIYHLPVALGCALLVIIVDAVVIFKAVRGQGGQR